MPGIFGNGVSLRLKWPALAILFAFIGQQQAVAQSPPARTPFEVGAARVDVTPSADKRPKNFLGVLDPLYARAIFIQNGTTKAALVSVDTGGIRTETWTRVTTRLDRELGIPAQNVMLSASHTHSAPFVVPDL